MILYIYIALGQGQTTSWGRNFDVNRNILSLRSFVEKISLKSDFIQFFFFHDFIHHPAGDVTRVSVMPRKVTMEIGDAENQCQECRDKNQ